MTDIDARNSLVKVQAIVLNMANRTSQKVDKR